MGNRLVHIARRMKANARNRGESDRVKENDKIHGSNLEAYIELAQRITMDLRNDDGGNEKDGGQTTSTGKADGAAEARNAEVHQHAVEIQEILDRIRECKIDNSMHAAKIQRLENSMS